MLVTSAEFIKGVLEMLFVTVGSQKFQFNRLLRAVDALVSTDAVEGGVFAQRGACGYIPKNYPSEAFLGRDRFSELMNQSDVVVTHGGTGAIIGAVKRGKRVVAVPRLACYGEHVDDHQVEIVRQFSNMGLIEPCYDTEKLAEAYRRVLRRKYRSYTSNTSKFIDDLGRYIDSTMPRRLMR